MCDADYTGVDCSLDLNHVPMLYAQHGNNTCDRTLKPCELVAIYADMFIEDSVYCSVQAFDVSVCHTQGNLTLPTEIQY